MILSPTKQNYFLYPSTVQTPLALVTLISTKKPDSGTWRRYIRVKHVSLDDSLLYCLQGWREGREADSGSSSRGCWPARALVKDASPGLVRSARTEGARSVTVRREAKRGEEQAGLILQYIVFITRETSFHIIHGEVRSRQRLTSI